MKPRLLDLFCGAGGAAVGYARAGFDVVGVDINIQPRYPFHFVQDDALEGLKRGYFQDGHGVVYLDYFAAIHASPPCQDYSRAMRHLAFSQPRLIEPVREALQATGLPWVIENVPGAPLIQHPTLDGRDGIEICGTQLGLRIGRHRLFESNFPMLPIAARCKCSEGYVMNPHNQPGRDRITAEFGRGDQEIPWRKEMGVEWMGRYEGRQAIPPAYTEHIGYQLLQALRHKAAA